MKSLNQVKEVTAIETLSLNCYIYRSQRQKGMFLYLKEKDNFESIPDSLLTLLGELDFSFEFNLSKSSKLVRAESEEVLRIMNENGYFLQMPPPKSELLGQKSN